MNKHGKRLKKWDDPNGECPLGSDCLFFVRTAGIKSRHTNYEANECKRASMN